MGPRLQSVRYDPRAGVVTAVFRDDRSGLNLASLLDPRNYDLFGRSGRKPTSPTITEVPSGDPLVTAVALTFDPRAPRPRYLRIVSGGVSDLAGNPLDGEDKGRGISGDGHPGGSYLAALVPSAAPRRAHAAPVPKGVRALSHRRHPGR